MSTHRDRFEEIRKKIKRESDGFPLPPPHPHIGGRRVHDISGAAAAGTLNTTTPCAACKLLRRRCAQECPFSPYFSPHEPRKFASVHKVFGASNVSKMLMEVPESQRADAANSLVYEANVRLRDPVYGCMGAVSSLQQQLQFLQAELNAVTAEILKCKYREIQVQLSSGAVSIPSPPPAGLPPTPSPYNTVTPSSAAAAAEFSINISNGNNNITYFG